MHLIVGVAAIAISYFGALWKVQNGDEVYRVINDIPYTYQDAWYYFWARICDVLVWGYIFYLTRSNIFLFILILCVGKVIDERSIPCLKFSVEEAFTLVIAIIAVTFRQWTISKKTSQTNSSA